MRSEKKRKPLYTMWVDGQEVEVLNYIVLYGITYADIRFADGSCRTISADKLSKQKEQKNEPKY